MQLLAPAKINLSFEIRGRRSDGFHEIETLMVPVSLFDRISIEKIPNRNRAIQFSCNDKSIPAGGDNLVVRAANLFRAATNIGDDLEISLDKAIPHGAGLGGGSSDAATTLMGLNQLFGGLLQNDDLTRLAAELGSDVPFFLAESAAKCRGRGEIVEPIPFAKRLTLLLLKSAFGVPTPWAYSRWKDAHEIPGIDYTEQMFEETRFVNDLERPVFEKFVILAQLKTWLRRQPDVAVALMSGSGSTVFAALNAGADPGAISMRAQKEIDPELWTCSCESVDRTFEARQNDPRCASTSPPHTRD
jgi:4-diphosphocytidyl-2-C-methyl-D-erythritol kinase